MALVKWNHGTASCSVGDEVETGSCHRRNHVVTAAREERAKSLNAIRLSGAAARRVRTFELELLDAVGRSERRLLPDDVVVGIERASSVEVVPVLVPGADVEYELAQA